MSIEGQGGTAAGTSHCISCSTQRATVLRVQTGPGTSQKAAGAGTLLHPRSASALPCPPADPPLIATAGCNSSILGEAAVKEGGGNSAFVAATFQNYPSKLKSWLKTNANAKISLFWNGVLPHLTPFSMEDLSSGIISLQQRVCGGGVDEHSQNKSKAGWVGGKIKNVLHAHQARQKCKTRVAKSHSSIKEGRRDCMTTVKMETHAPLKATTTRLAAVALFCVHYKLQIHWID